MNRGEAEDTLIGLLNDNMPIVPVNSYGVTAGAIPTSRVEYPNAKFRKPNNEVFLSLSTTFADGENIEASPTGLIRTDGVFVIVSRVPKNTGRTIANSIADQLAILYRQKRFDGMVIESNQVDTLGGREDWYTKQINVFFYIEEN